MKKILIILVMITYSLCTQAQIIEQIKKEYANLDAQLYIDSLRNWYKNFQISKYNIVKSGTDKEIMRNFCMGCENFDNEEMHNFAESIRKSSWSDSLVYAKKIKSLENYISLPSPHFVLKLSIIGNQIYIDSSYFKYDLYLIGPKPIKYSPSIYIYYPKEVCICDYFYPSFSPRTAKRSSIAIQKILKKNPFCLLSCPQIPGLLYMLNDEIFVFDLTDMKEYEINEYLLLNAGTNKISGKNFN